MRWGRGVASGDRRALLGGWGVGARLGSTAARRVRWSPRRRGAASVSTSPERDAPALDRSMASGDRRADSGQGLVVALVALLLLGAVFALVAGMLVSRMQRAQDDARETVLLALADAAVAESLANLAAHPGSAGVERRPFGGGTIESTVTRTGREGFRLTAVATYRGEGLTVEAVGRLTELGPVVDGWRRVPASEAEEGGGGSFQGR